MNEVIIAKAEIKRANASLNKLMDVMGSTTVEARSS